MGGPGSGDWMRDARKKGKATVKDFPSLDIRDWHWLGLLKPKLEFSCAWTLKDKAHHIATVRVHARDALELTYMEPLPHQNWRPAREHFQMVWTDCQYGGCRPWFVCPGCDRRVAILYHDHCHYCRHCHRLTYPSCNQTAVERAIHKARKIRKRLQASPDSIMPITQKPKGMHQRTFNRLRQDLTEATWVVNDYLDKNIGIVRTRLEEVGVSGSAKAGKRPENGDGQRVSAASSRAIVQAVARIRTA